MEIVGDQFFICVIPHLLVENAHKFFSRGKSPTPKLSAGSSVDMGRRLGRPLEPEHALVPGDTRQAVGLLSRFSGSLRRMPNRIAVDALARLGAHPTTMRQRGCDRQAAIAGPGIAYNRCPSWMLISGPISRYRLRPPHPASPSPYLFSLTVVRLAPVLPDRSLRAAARPAAVFAPGALQGLLSSDRLPRFNFKQLLKAVRMAMGTTVFRIRAELIFRRCCYLITPSHVSSLSAPVLRAASLQPAVLPFQRRGRSARALIAQPPSKCPVVPVYDSSP
jgi:hypothetical protein